MEKFLTFAKRPELDRAFSGGESITFETFERLASQPQFIQSVGWSPMSVMIVQDQISEFKKQGQVSDKRPSSSQENCPGECLTMEVTEQDFLNATCISHENSTGESLMFEEAVFVSAQVLPRRPVSAGNFEHISDNEEEPEDDPDL